VYTPHEDLTDGKKAEACLYNWVEIHEDERTVLYRTKLLDGIKPNTNPNPKLTQVLILFGCFMLFFEHRPLIFSLAAESNIQTYFIETEVNSAAKPDMYKGNWSYS